MAARLSNVKYLGIGRAAQLLGCSRAHLWMTLEERHNRKSIRLTARYRALTRSHRWDGKDWIKRGV